MWEKDSESKIKNCAMKQLKIIPIIIGFWGSIAWTDFFPIGGFLCKNLNQADSCNINTALFYCGTDWNWLDSVFAVANTLNMKIILATAAQPNDAQQHNIQRFSGGQWSIYEAESTCFTHQLGALVNDPSASGGKAWAVSTTGTGWFQIGPWTDEQFVYWTDSLVYYAYFKLKTNDNTGTNAVCTLYVRKATETDTIVKAKRAIKGQAFSQTGVYEEFLVSFKMDRHEAGTIDYSIRYMGTNDSLYGDNVDVRDAVADSLKNGDFTYFIQQIAGYYKLKPAMFRYYMWDEPQLDQFWASKEVNWLLKSEDENRGGIQAITKEGVLNTYLGSVKTDELIIDRYPFLGKDRWEGRTPEDSGSLFQERIDWYCDYLAEARNAVKLHPGKNFWLSSQAFGHDRTDSQWTWKPEWNDSIPFEDEGRFREPTPRELRCMVWLGLAYGAKGICHFLYPSGHDILYDPDSNKVFYYWVAGLTNPDGAKRALWYTTRIINQELEGIGSRLLSLSSDTVFKANTTPPTNCFIKSVSDTLMQIGTFHDNTSDYFIIVNRHCLLSETVTVKIGTERPTTDSLYYLYDCLTNEVIDAASPDSNPIYIQHFMIELLPGQGRLFRLIPSAQRKQ